MDGPLSIELRGSCLYGIHGNNRIPKCCCPNSAILRPRNFDRHPVPVITFEAVNGQTAEADELFLQRGYPRFELATTLLAPVGWRLRVNDLANDFVVRTSRSMPEPTKSTLKKHRRQSLKVWSMAKDNARFTI